MELGSATESHDASQQMGLVYIIAFGTVRGSMPRAPNMFCVYIFFHPAGRLPVFFLSVKNKTLKQLQGFGGRNGFSMFFHDGTTYSDV